jgi:hypothetical protein
MLLGQYNNNGLPLFFPCAVSVYIKYTVRERSNYAVAYWIEGFGLQNDDDTSSYTVRGRFRKLYGGGGGNALTDTLFIGPLAAVANADGV